jgi:RimJ/RimL family protein N-acetyltransferase
MRRPAPDDPTLPSCARRLQQKKQNSHPSEILLLLRFDTITSQRGGLPWHSLSGWSIMGTGEGQVLQLTDGSEVVVRPIGPDDASLMQAFVRRLSARSRRFRFFVALAELPAAQLDRFVNVDPARGLALVALSGRQEDAAIVAEARYAKAQEDDNAEFAIAVADDFQRRGLGRHLVKRLLATAWRRGVRRVIGEIKSDNRAMLAFAKRLGFRLQSSREDQSVVIASSVAPLRV